MMSTQIFHRQVWPLRERLYRVAYRLLGERTEAEDVVQDTMIKLWEKRAELGTINNVEAWCIRLLKNQGIDRFRKLQRRNTQGLDETHDLPSRDMNPNKKLQQQELRQHIHAVIQALPLQRRMVVHLREIEGQSYQEIADALDLSLDQVRTDLHRARKSLRAALSKNICHE